jgi:hypothetical protein
MKCTICGTNNQSPGAEPYCGSCWAKDTTSTVSGFPGYQETMQTLANVTGKRCRICNRQLYVLPGDDRNANICTNCA